MKIALIGATGFVGAAVRAELLRRGHQVTALVREASRLAPEPGLVPVVADVYDADAVAGREVAGRVDAIGTGVDPSWSGKRVVAHLGMTSGGYAEQALAAARAFWADPDLTPETLSILAAFAASSVPDNLTGTNRNRYRAWRQNALRMLIYASPDLQTS